MADSNEKLFSDFAPVTTEQWMEKVTADLKGADYEKKLVWKTNEGFKVKPFYRMEDLEGLKTVDALPGEFPYLRGTKKSNVWLVRQDINVVDPVEANKKALDILMKGIDSLSFRIDSKDLKAEVIETLLKDICAESVELNFSTCQRHVVELAQLLVAYFEKKDYDLKKLQGSINYDYFNKMLVDGKEKGDLVQTAKSLIEAVQPLPFYRVLNVNALTLNNAGAYISQELGYALAWGNEYLRQLTDAGLPATVVAKKIKFNFGISSNYFLEIAKFRAARMLWANIVASYEQHKTGRMIGGFSFTFINKQQPKEVTHSKAKKLTDKQIQFFANKLAHHDPFASQKAAVGESYADLEKRLVTELQDPEVVRKYADVLKELGLDV